MCFGTLNTISLLIFFISFKKKKKNYKIDNYKIDFFIIIYDI
jgi:hypothetical protein